MTRAVRTPTLNGSVRGSKSVVGGMRQSEASSPTDTVEGSKSFRPGRPVKRIVRAVLHELGLQQRRG